MRVFRRGKVWYCWFYENGVRVQRSTQCHDRRAAEVRARELERDASDPAHAAARKASLSDALQLLLRLDDEEIRAGRRSADTKAFHERKAGHLIRVFETKDDVRVPFPLADLGAPEVDGYISTRRAEEASDQTIAKELLVLRKALRLALRARLWLGRVDQVIPVAFSPGYEPRKRFLTPDELAKLLAELTPDRAARAAFIVATSACWRETELALTEDISLDLRSVLLRGTKRKTRFRTVPVVSPVQRSLVEYALRYAAGEGESLFQPWGNVRRDLAAACERAKIERASPNDLRRTFANWYVAAGVPLFPIAQAMGHKDTRMLERAYGRQSPDQLAVAFSRALGLAPDCSAGATEPAEKAGSGGPDGPSGMDSATSPQLALFAENQRARRTLQSDEPRCASQEAVPGGGIEPPTRGFSVPCSTY